MTIEKSATEIITLTRKGPIPGGIGAQIRELAEGIEQTFDWVDAEEPPKIEHLVMARYDDGTEAQDWYDRMVKKPRWYSGKTVVSWRELV